MELQPMTMDKDLARKYYLEYRKAVKKRQDLECKEIMRGYRELAKGNPVLDLQPVFSQCPLDDKSRPKLAIAQASEKYVYCSLGSASCVFYWGRAVVSRNNRAWLNPRASRSQLQVPLPYNANRREWNNYNDLRGVVPIIPPRFMPNIITSKHFILWEVDRWDEVPGDPLLLRQINNYLFVILAQWDLTPLERAVLANTRALG